MKFQYLNPQRWWSSAARHPKLGWKMLLSLIFKLKDPLIFNLMLVCVFWPACRQPRLLQPANSISNLSFKLNPIIKGCKPLPRGWSLQAGWSIIFYDFLSLVNDRLPPYYRFKLSQGWIICWLHGWKAPKFSILYTAVQITYLRTICKEETIKVSWNAWTFSFECKFKMMQPFDCSLELLISCWSRQISHLAPCCPDRTLKEAEICDGEGLLSSHCLNAWL